ncbi:MAG: hypothetical protein ACRDYX_04465 [Egibacteraceae bacterium]
MRDKSRKHGERHHRRFRQLLRGRGAFVLLATGTRGLRRAGSTSTMTRSYQSKRSRHLR